VGNVFSIHPTLGDLQLSRPLDFGSVSEYMVSIRASDNGNPPLASTLIVHVMVTMADNAPPRYVNITNISQVFTLLADLLCTVATVADELLAIWQQIVYYNNGYQGHTLFTLATVALVTVFIWVV